MPHDIDAREFAANARNLLLEDPRRYRSFGVYWYFVKALLKRLYDRHEMPLIGDYSDNSVNDRIPPVGDARELMALAAEEYARNASFNLGRNKVEDPDGEGFFLFDPDLEGA